MIKIEDKAFLIHKIKFSETSIIASFLSENNGVYKGLIKGALNKKNNNIFEIGNKFKFETKVRNEDSLANLKIEIIDNNFSDLVNEKIKLLMILNLAELVNLIFPEKLNISNLFYHFSDFIQNIVILDSKIELLKIYSRFELLILTEMYSL